MPAKFHAKRLQAKKLNSTSKRSLNTSDKYLDCEITNAMPNFNPVENAKYTIDVDLDYKNYPTSVTYEDIDNFFNQKVNNQLVKEQNSLLKELEQAFISSIVTSVGLSSTEIQAYDNAHNMPNKTHNQNIIHTDEIIMVNNKYKTDLKPNKSSLIAEGFTIITLELFAEIKDIMENGFNSNQLDSFLDALKLRFSKFKDRVINRFKNSQLFNTDLQTFLSNAVSNIISTILNIFVSAGKKSMELIKLGVFSLISGFKEMLDSSKPLDVRLHNASKLMLSSFTVGGIVLLDIAFFNSLPTFITLPLTTLFSGLAGVLVAWLWDKLDLFNVNKNEINLIKNNAISDLRNNNTLLVKSNNELIDKILEDIS